MTVKKITPVLFVEEVEPCAKFWMDRLGFEKTVEVPEGNNLGFAILHRGNVELMYQSYAALTKTPPRPLRPLVKARPSSTWKSRT